MTKDTIPKGVGRRHSTPRHISRYQLTGCRWGHVCSAGSDRLRSSPRRMAPGTRRRHTGSLRAGSACLHSGRTNELVVTNQKRGGAAIFIPLYPFSYWPQPKLDQLLSTSAPSYFQTAESRGRNKVCKPSRPGTTALLPAAALLPLPSPARTVWAG